MTTKSIARFGLLMGVAMVLGYFERFIPITAGLPGVKLGLANTVLLYALFLLGNKEAFTLMFFKVVLSGLIYAGVSGMMYSFAGGLLSLVAMMLLKNIDSVTIIGVSITGAVFHNLGQLIMAWMVVGTMGVFAYMPFLLIAGIVTGLLTGTVANTVIKSLEGISRRSRSDHQLFLKNQHTSARTRV